LREPSAPPRIVEVAGNSDQQGVGNGVVRQASELAIEFVAERSSGAVSRRDRIVAFAIARLKRAREQKQSCRAHAAHAWIWAIAGALTSTRTKEAKWQSRVSASPGA
jgi:hypothetical protein